MFCFRVARKIACKDTAFFRHTQEFSCFFILFHLFSWLRQNLGKEIIVPLAKKKSSSPLFVAFSRYRMTIRQISSSAASLHDMPSLACGASLDVTPSSTAYSLPSRTCPLRKPPAPCHHLFLAVYIVLRCVVSFWLLVVVLYALLKKAPFRTPSINSSGVSPHGRNPAWGS